MSVCVDVELYETVQRIAQKEYRTVSQQAFYWLRQAVEAYQQGEQERKIAPSDGGTILERIE